MLRIVPAIVSLTVACFVYGQAPPPPPAVVQAPPQVRVQAGPVQVRVNQAPNPYGIELAPGEVLTHVNGVPVGGPRAQVQTVQVRPTSSCPTCAPGSTYQTNTPAPSNVSGLPHQATARARARYMARNNYRNHPPGSFGTNFEGVGWTSNRNGTPPTCIPGRRGGVPDTSSSSWVLVGDAIERGPGGAYRVRLWNKAGNTTQVSTQPTSGRSGGRSRGGLFRRLFRR